MGMDYEPEGMPRFDEKMDWEYNRSEDRAQEIVDRYPNEVGHPGEVHLIACCMGYDYDAAEQYLISQDFDPGGADDLMRRTVHEHMTGGGQ